MQNMLDEIITNKKLEIQQRKIKLSLAELKQRVRPGDNSFLGAIKKPGLNIIAEIKPKSPSAGTLCADLPLDRVISIYNKYACAISVLTDKKFFAGSLDLLAQVSQQSPLPTLCKDFILDPYQCFLARLSGAQAVLLIVKILSQKKLEELYKQINELKMTAIVEVQNLADLERARLLEPEVILINNRNLEDFKINFDTTKILSKFLKSANSSAQLISASGLKSRTDIEDLMPFCSTFLIGSHFMRSINLEEEFKELTKTSPHYQSYQSGVYK